MIDTLVNILLVFIVSSSCALFGNHIIINLSLGGLKKFESLILSITLGLGCLIYTLLLLGYINLFNQFSAWIIICFFIFIGRSQISKIIRLINSFSFYDLINNLSISSIFIFFVLSSYFLVGLTPTFDGDSLSGYLVIPREFSKTGGINEPTYVYNFGQPGNGYMLSSLGFLLNNQILAQLLVVTLPLLLIV